MSYSTEAKKISSEKILLATCEAVQRLKLFTLSGGDYERTVSYFVVGAKDGATPLVAASLPLSSGQYNFNPLTMKLTVDVGANPDTRDISVTYRFFFSDTPLILPYDLSSGTAVEWQPFINSVGSIGQSLDDQSTGIVLESSTTISMANAGYFDAIYDTLIWENQAVKIYSWFPNIPITDKVQMFDGIIDSKSFSDTAVTFKVKDFVYKLRSLVNLGSFSDSDGIILPSLIGKAKRRIYGQADNVKCASLDATLDGYSLTGTISGTAGLTAITGSGTSFLDEVSQGDEIIVSVSGVSYKLKVLTVLSDTSITTSSELAVSFNGISSKNLPVSPWRKKNRTWQLAGHKLIEPTATITAVNSLNSFSVNSTDGFFSGNTITVNGVTTTVRNVSGLKIITNTNISPSPSVSQLIKRSPVPEVYFGKNKLILSRDYTISNASVCNLIIDPLAEFNITNQSTTSFSVVFTNASRTITTASTVDFRSFLKPRDWIRSTNITKPTWYEILSVESQTLTIRVPFADGTATETAYYKAIDAIDESSLVTANCTGMDNSGQWIRTASDAVRNMILNDAQFASVNETAFAKAKADCDYILSLVLPASLGSIAPDIRGTITQINESVFGSLYGDSSQNISYAVMNSTKPEISEVITDSDIISFSVSSEQSIVNSVKVNYAPFVDYNSGEDSFKTLTETSSFVDNLIGISNAIEKTIYLYDEAKAKIIAQRMLLFKSLSNSIVTINSKMSLAQTVVNDKLYISLDRLFSRFSSSVKEKIGTVISVKRTGSDTQLQLSDIGNVYNRVMSIAPNTTNIYTNSSNEDKIKYGFILSNTMETPDGSSEVGLGSNIIG